MKRHITSSRQQSFGEVKHKHVLHRNNTNINYKFEDDASISKCIYLAQSYFRWKKLKENNNQKT